jgi:hypothetical protein
VFSGLLFLTYAKADPPVAAAKSGDAGSVPASRPRQGPAETLPATYARDVQAELDEIRKLLPGQPD